MLKQKCFHLSLFEVKYFCLKLKMSLISSLIVLLILLIVGCKSYTFRNITMKNDDINADRYNTTIILNSFDTYYELCYHIRTECYYPLFIMEYINIDYDDYDEYLIVKYI